MKEIFGAGVDSLVVTSVVAMAEGEGVPTCSKYRVTSAALVQ